MGDIVAGVKLWPTTWPLCLSVTPPHGPSTILSRLAFGVAFLNGITVFVFGTV